MSAPMCITCGAYVATVGDQCETCATGGHAWEWDGPKPSTRVERWTGDLDDGTQVLVETTDHITFTIASRPRALRVLPWSPPITLEPGQ